MGKIRAFQEMNQIWKESTVKQREDLLKGLGFNVDWAQLDDLEEIADRGGGFVTRDVVKLYERGFK